ncbi:collagen-like protein [Veillonella sp.]|uniref:collagen-like triple helix repeat-containing protein n=1 Tax=Veillonella sp. TaxID=1926307 RepID=UPI00290B9261|nr:collagen-like protein [Veillonella sp.]MDU7497576.1 collagen-like protein [Veillonella sp.]
MESNELILKLDKETTIPLIEGLGKSAYAIAVAHGFRGTEQEWLDSLKGLQGPQGEPGPKGDPFRYEDFTPEQLSALKGPKGDKGEDGRDGVSATAEKAAEFFKRKNIYLENADIDTILSTLLERLDGLIPADDYDPLTYLQPLKGQTTLAVQGQPHFKVSVNGGDKHVFETKGLELPIAAFGEDDITLKYYDLIDREVSTVTVSGVTDNEGTPDDTYEQNGAKYALYGNRLIVNVSNYNGNSYNPFVFMGKWAYDKVNDITINTNKAKGLHIGNNSLLNLGNKPVYVTNPEFITLRPNTYVAGQAANIGTLQQGTTMTHFYADEYSWSSSEHRYVATGVEWGPL